MANGIYSFGDVFTQAYLEGERRKQEQQQFQQQMGFNERQLTLLDAFRQKELASQENRFQQEFGYKVGQTAVENEFTRQKIGLDTRRTDIDEKQGDRKLTLMDLAQQQDYEVANKNIGLGYSRLNQDQAQFDENMQFQKDYIIPIKQMSEQTDRMNANQYSGMNKKESAITDAVSKAQGSLSQIKALKSSGIYDGKDYEKYKGQATENVYSALKQLGIDNTILNQIRSVANPDDDAETKKELFTLAINELAKENKWDATTIETLRLWKEIGTE